MAQLINLQNSHCQRNMEENLEGWREGKKGRHRRSGCPGHRPEGGGGGGGGVILRGEIGLMKL